MDRQSRKVDEIYKSAIHKLLEQISKRNQRLSKLKDDLQAKDSQIKDLEKSLEEKSVRITEFSSNLKAKDTQITEINSALKAKDSEIRNLEIQIQLIQRGIVMHFLRKYRRVVDKLLRPGTRRRYYYRLGLKGIRVILNEGWRSFFRKFRMWFQRKPRRSR